MMVATVATVLLHSVYRNRKTWEFGTRAYDDERTFLLLLLVFFGLEIKLYIEMDL